MNYTDDNTDNDKKWNLTLTESIYPLKLFSKGQLMLPKTMSPLKGAILPAYMANNAKHSSYVQAW